MTTIRDSACNERGFALRKALLAALVASLSQIMLFQAGRVGRAQVVVAALFGGLLMFISAYCLVIPRILKARASREMSVRDLMWVAAALAAVSGYTAISR